MNLKKAENVNTRYGHPTININKNGIMRFSAPVISSLKLKVGEGISFYQDEDNARDWYIMPNEESIVLRNTSDKSTVLYANSKAISSRILKSLDMDEKATMRVCLEPTEGGYYAIITSGVTGR